MIGQERMTETLDANSSVCHKKTELQYAGHMFINENNNDFVQLANRLGIKMKLTGRELALDNQINCTSQHKN